MKKKKRWIALATVVLLLATVLCGYIYIQAEEKESALNENQRYVYAYVASMEGNEITYMEVDETMIESEEKENDEEDETAEETKETDRGALSDGEDEQRGEVPSGREMPLGGEMPSDGEMSSGGEMPSDRKMLSGGETVTTYIPVGVTVHTTDDTATTFSRLVSGDVLKLLVETNAAGEDVIEEIWMIEQ